MFEVEFGIAVYLQEGEVPWCIMLLTAATVLMGSTALGFVFGLAMGALVALAAALPAWMAALSRWRSHRANADSTMA
eukprot:scaffold306136_cov41-Prasinocladus_malaysianus.AAC.2